MLVDKCVDIKLSLQLSNHKAPLAAELLDILLTELPQNHLGINRAFAECRYNDALELLHKLHGNCCYCGVPQLKAACKKLEQQLHAKQHPPLAYDIRVFNEAVSALLAWHKNHDIHNLFSLAK
jgi:two-component system sensor histidine kinase BarA